MTIYRGEIYFVNLNPVQGREQSGQRPVLVISSDVINQLPLVITVIVGTKEQNIAQDYPTNIRIPAHEGGLPMETVFLGFQLRSIDHNRFTSAPIGKLSDGRMKQIDDIVRYCLGL
ncbi:MAG: type II toxin-antitoxin system PemK/MazF family toxin [Anaerolineae bacterium]|jgi:mRNA interferase MazF|nr:type II toxin-antitoxin system PemK/MazF family toxin [Anaerolineae bacterium]